jgi:hypothetical protein
MTDPDTHARGLAAASASPTGWFEELYSQAQRGDAVVPWDSGTPHALLVDWAKDRDGAGLRARSSSAAARWGRRRSRCWRARASGS